MADEHALVLGVQAMLLATANAQPVVDRLAKLNGAEKASPDLRLAAKAANDAIWVAVKQSRTAVKVASTLSWQAHNCSRVRGIPVDVGRIAVETSETLNAALFCIELVDEQAVRVAGAIRQFMELESL